MPNLLKIREIAKEKKIPIRELASEIGITEQGLQKLIRENSTKVETLEAIARILKVSISVFFDEKVIALNDATPDKLLLMGADVFAVQLNNLVENKILAPYSLISEKDKEIRELNREIGRLQAKLEAQKKMNVQEVGNAICADAK